MLGAGVDDVVWNEEGSKIAGIDAESPGKFNYSAI